MDISELKILLADLLIANKDLEKAVVATKAENEELKKRLKQTQADQENETSEETKKKPDNENPPTNIGEFKK